MGNFVSNFFVFHASSNRTKQQLCFQKENSVSQTNAFDEQLIELLQKVIPASKDEENKDERFLCIGVDGVHLPSTAELTLYKRWGAQAVAFHVVEEARLVAELCMSYGCVVVAANRDFAVEPEDGQRIRGENVVRPTPFDLTADWTLLKRALVEIHGNWEITNGPLQAAYVELISSS